jgi:ABC-type multidrug transport system fused ATPase/permease subunit
MEKPSAETRKHSFRLIHECITGLGWRYKVYATGFILMSLVFILPPMLLQNFTKGVTDLQALSAVDFIRNLALFGVFIAICQWIGIFVGSYLSEWLRLTVSIGLRRKVLHSLHQTQIESLDVAHRGDWLTRMTSDLRNCERFISDSIPEQARNLTVMLGVAVMFFIKSGSVAFIPIAAAALLFCLNVYVQKRMAPVLGQVRMLEGSIFQQMIESFEGLKTIRSYGGESSTARKVEGGLSKLFDSGLHIIRRMGALMGVNELASQLVITLVLSIAAMAVRGNQLTATEVLVFPFYINMFLNATKTLVASTYEWNRYFIEGGRLAGVFYDENSHIPDPESLFGDVGSIDEFRSLDVKDLTVGYGEAPPVIDGHKFHIEAGEIVAVMGESGCGKSTFLEVVAGLRGARSGEFQIRNGSTVHQWTQVPVFVSSYVEQRPYLFVGSFRENVTLGMDDENGESHISDDQIREALERVDLAHIVENRGGIDEVLTDRGQNLSEGQRYRLALVRALLAHRPLILLDEPFAALDDDSIRSVVKALREEAARGAAIILVTHLIPETMEDVRVVEMKPLHKRQGPGPGPRPGGPPMGPPPGMG